jgi:nitrate/nitrite-specific signal transduction histidine kinase
LRTLLPLGLLVSTFGVVGQIGYTQVSEALAKSRDTEIAKIEAARVGDYLLDAARVLRQLAGSSPVLARDADRIKPMLKEEQLSQHFDYVQVTDEEGAVIAASDGKLDRRALVLSSFYYVQGPDLPMALAPGVVDGKNAMVFTTRFTDSTGQFLGVVEGAVTYGSNKLGVPLVDSISGVYGTRPSSSASGFSYLSTADGIILWHPSEDKAGTYTRIPTPADSNDLAPRAEVLPIDGVRSIVGYAPLNLGQLLTKTRVERPWLEWMVITQHRWSDVVEPINALRYWLVILAFAMFVLALSLVVRSANALTVPVARLVSAAQALSVGRLRHRLDLLEINGPTEIEELARQFNSMAAQLHTSYTDLEQKVSDRTKELATANAELARRLRETQTTQMVAAKFAGTAALDEILQLIASSAADAMDTEGSVVFLPSQSHPNELEVAVVYNMPGLSVGDFVPVDATLTGLTYKTGQIQISTEIAGDSRVNASYAHITGARTVLSAPLVSRGQVIGVINTINKRLGQFGEDDIRLLGLLANQAAVAVERARLYSSARKQVDTLETVNELALSVTASRTVKDTLTGGMEHIGKLLGASAAVVFLHSEKTRTLEYVASYNMHPDHFVIVTNQPIRTDQEYERPIAVLEAYRTQQPFTILDMSNPTYLTQWGAHVAPSAGGFTQENLDKVNVRSLTALPLTVHDKRLGAMALYFPEAQQREFRPDELRLFQSFANILALAVHNSQLVAQTSKLATVEERARLARELHDSVTQSLFSLNLTLRAARRNVASNPAKAEKLFDDVQDLAQGALAEMRALIFELRPQALVNEGLVSALQKHAEAVRARSGLRVNLQIIGDRRLPIESEEALYQIAREALHNVVKHAHATEAWVDLDLGGPEVRMAVRDDGRGFDTSVLAHEGGSHIGTSTMRERSEAIGAELELKSYPGGGTEVFVRLPVLDDQDLTGDADPELEDEQSTIAEARTPVSNQN